MSVSRADGVFKSDEELRDGLLKLLLLGQFGIDNRTGSTCHCFPPCSLFLDCAKEVIAGSFPECLYEIRKADTEADNVAICGNGLVEMGESCDCLVSDTDCRKCCDMTVCYKLADTCSGVTYEVKPADKLTTTKMSTTVTEQPKGKNPTTGTTSKTHGKHGHSDLSDGRRIVCSSSWLPSLCGHATATQNSVIDDTNDETDDAER